jgi:peptidoglycan-associated lipoprotein
MPLESKTPMKRLFSLFLSLVVLVSFAALTGCSKTTSGKDGKEGLSEAELNAQREGRFGEGGIPTAEGEGIFRDINFDFDSSVIKPEARLDIDYNAQVLKEHQNWRVSIEGHCDERGTSDYNMALGLARAKAVQEVLLSFGIPRPRLDTISYGAEVPLDPGHNETAWAKNRRVHFSPFTNNAQ